MGGRGFISRREHFPIVSSTNDVVADWLEAGTPEVCLAVADEQAAGRGRAGRSWQVPAGAGLLLSLGFRPDWLEPERMWRLAAVASLGMADAAERLAGLNAGAIRLKWPNDLVVMDEGSVRKLAGVLGETNGLGGPDPQVVIGLGVNVDWAAEDFPDELRSGMTSLREISGRQLSTPDLLDAFLVDLEERVRRLREGAFDTDGWRDRQLTKDQPVRLEHADGSGEVVHAKSVDPLSGGLIVERSGVERIVMTGEIRHLRLEPATKPAPPTPAGV